MRRIPLSNVSPLTSKLDSGVDEDEDEDGKEGMREPGNVDPYDEG
jgi:hypothetical protein